MAGADKPILVVGATGYIGGRLVPRLLERGQTVRCLARSPERLSGYDWGERVDVRRGDVLDPDSLAPALEGVGVAYYLVHSMSGGEKGFEDRDQRAARNFARAAREAGVERIIYLGGLGSGEDLSPHLRSRQEVGEILAREGPPVTEFRAAVIVGAGSISFEMVRYLVERLPVMICPRWVRTRTQPIAVDDVLRYLLDCLAEPRSTGRVLEIGGADVLSYEDMMREYAHQRGLRRWMLHVPVLTPRLSSYWVNVVTPIPASIARPLVGGLRSETVCHDSSARELFPFEPMNYAEAVRLAREQSRQNQVETIWSTPLSRLGTRAEPVELADEQGMIRERRQREVQAPAGEVYATFTGIGGARGWFAYDWAWRLRGFLDRLIGGVGLRRGRRHPDEVRIGEALDFWRVEAVEPGRLLRLRAEMKVPGLAWLEFVVEPADEGRSCLTQTAYFEPRGLGGFLYWYGLYPIHQLIFRALIRAVARRAEERVSLGEPAAPHASGVGREG
jgi:uncharacterized protein YbjT (DUF2867 family)